MYLGHFYSINKTQVKYLFEMARHLGTLEAFGIADKEEDTVPVIRTMYALIFEPSMHKPLINGGILLTK